MKSVVLCLVTLLCVLPGLTAAEMTETRSSGDSNEVLRAFLQLQQQLHASQLAIEAIRKESGEAAAKNADALAETAAKNAKALTESSTALAERLKSIEQSISNQRSEELRTIQNSSRIMLWVAGGFALLGAAAMVLMAFFQWRTINRLTEISGALPQVHALSAPPEVRALGAGPELPSLQVQEVNARLASALGQLEKRILSLEERSRLPLHQPQSLAERHNGNGAPTVEAGGAGDLLARGQALLEQDQAAEALELFQQAATLEAGSAEAHVRAGSALEKLGRLEEALRSFDRALEIDSNLALAHLHKGGILNRMEKYSEALECYERALRTQEKVA